MDVPIGNMTLSQHTWRWLIIIPCIQARLGKQFKKITVWRNITMQIGKMKQCLLSVKICNGFSEMLPIK